MTAKYYGVNRGGTAVAGTLPEGRDIADFVRSRYVARWQSLTVEDHDAPPGGEVLGQIFHRGGRRHWWAAANLFADGIVTDQDPPQ